MVIEVDAAKDSSSRLKRLATLGVPEVWQHDGEHMHFFQLRDGEYRPVERSQSFPMVKPGDIERILELRTEMGENAVVREFLKWLREQP